MSHVKVDFNAMAYVLVTFMEMIKQSGLQSPLAHSITHSYSNVDKCCPTISW
jgi:hypothetical protein